MNTGIDWEGLAEAAKTKRSLVWEALLASKKGLDEFVPECQDEIGDAYKDLQITFHKAKVLLLEARGPYREELEPVETTEDIVRSSFGQQIRSTYRRLDEECEDRGKSRVDREATLKILEDLISTGAVSDPLT